MPIPSLKAARLAADFDDPAAGRPRGPDAAPAGPWCEAADLADVPLSAWVRLADAAASPNAFFLPEWAGAVNAHATGKTGARALLAWDGPARTRLIGLLPVVSAWRALRLPIPALVAWQAYAPLTTPLLDREALDAAAGGLIGAARRAGAHALLLPFVETESAAAAALHRAATALGTASKTMAVHRRARLDASHDPERLLRTGLGAKKLKELRRQRHRLADAGDVVFAAASSPADLPPALAVFLGLESRGWKGRRGTALACDAGDIAFVREAMTALAAKGQAQVVTLARGGEPAAAGLVLRHGRRAFFFKIAYDERAAALSPGVQLTLDLTRRLCAEAAIDDADSIAVAGHRMIDRIWPARLGVADLLLPTRPDSAAVVSAFAALIAGRRAAREGVRRVARRLRRSRAVRRLS